MTDTDRAAGAARKLHEEYAARRPIAPLPEALRPRDLAAAYAVQDALQALYLADGRGPLAGWKIALTTPVMQQMVGVDHPCAGGIVAQLVQDSPAQARAADFIKLGVESEIAVRLGADLPGGDRPHDKESVAGAVAACMAAIEIVDEQDADYDRLDAPLLIADNAFNFGCVLGPPVTDWRGLDLAGLAGRMTINGEIVGEGRGGDVMGHPLSALAWLANNLVERGRMLKAGEVVLTGSIVATKRPQAGDQVATVIDGLGEARLSVV